MEEGIPQADVSSFIRESLSPLIKSPLFWGRAFSAGLSFLFGYDAGIISGALLYIRHEFDVVTQSSWLQGAMVSVALVGAAIGALVGGWINDRFGRRKSMLFAAVFFFIGALIFYFS